LRELKTWGTFGKGWTSRVQGVRSAALADMGDNDTLHGAPVGAPKPDYAPTPQKKPTQGAGAKKWTVAGAVAAILAAIAAWVTNGGTP
jgi:lysozyme family protein